MALVGKDIDEGLMNILGHAIGIAANIEIGPFLQPLVNVIGILDQAILDIDLKGLVSGKSEIQFCGSNSF